MREILFRGKRTDNGEWVEGSLVHQTLYYGDPVDRYHIIYDGEFDYDYYRSERVIPETVGQYTGLIDKNGKKIFEGDILQYGDTKRFFHVEFLDGEFVVIESKKPPHIWSVPIATCVSQVEVIGNIHDNPRIAERREHRMRDKLIEIMKYRRHLETSELADVLLENGVAEVKHGEWVSHEGYEECGECRTKAIYPHNYCPNCGAKMDGGQTE